MMDGLRDTEQAVLGIMPEQYDEAAEMLTRLIRNTSNSQTKIKVVGHSLGGAVAVYATLLQDDLKRVTTTTFNPAGLYPTNQIKKAYMSASSVITNIRVKGDKVSQTGVLVGTTYDVTNYMEQYGFGSLGTSHKIAWTIRYMIMDARTNATGNNIDGDNVTDNGTFSDGEAVENGDSVYQSSDAAYQILLNGGVDSQTVENGDLVCLPSDDNNYITEEENNENPDNSGNIVAGGSGIGKIVDAALDEAAIVKPTISHKRILWLFSGESMWDSFKSVGKSLAENIKLSELREKFSDMWGEVVGKNSSNMSDIESDIGSVKQYLDWTEE